MANSRQTLPPLGARKGSKGSEERTGSTGSTKVGGQRRPSGREADRPSAPLRVQIAGASHEVAGAEKKPMVLLELKGISFEDLTDYRIQWRSLLPWVLEKDGTDIKDFSEDAYLHDPFLAVPLQLPGLIQLRMFQKKFPDNIAAWNDWCRAAKKEMEWLWRSCDPFPVHLPAPNPLGVSLEVSEEDGASLVVFLSFALPRDVSVPDDVPLHWQYRWRDATFGHGQEDCCVDSFETLLKERGTPRVRSPALRGDWECTSVIFSVRYLLGSSWSAWSDFASGSPNWAPWQGQPKLSISSCGFTKAILSLASPACVGHVKAQIRIEVGQVQGAMQTVLVTERPSFQAQTFTCPLRALRPGNSYTVRVSSRRWRIDHEWQEQLQELQQPLTGSEQGVPPMWALAPGMLEEVHVDGDLDWYPFWLHPIIASWPMDGVSAEWRREAPGEEWWTLTACERSSLHAARQKDARLAKGSGLRILLPKLTTWILVRLRHTCGLVTSSTRIRPSLLPLQEKPLATLVAKDSGLAIQLSLAEDHCGTMIQFMATAESKINKGDVGAQISHELEPCCLRPLADEAPVRHLVDVEELRMSPVEAGGMVRLIRLQGQSIGKAVQKHPDDCKALEMQFLMRSQKNAEAEAIRKEWIAKSVIPLLKNCQIFQGFSTKLISKIAAPLLKIQFAAGKDLCVAGDLADSMMVIIDGEVEAKCKEGKPVARLMTSAVTGELAILGLLSFRTATLTACRQTDTVVVTSAGLRSILKSSEAASKHLQKLAQEKLSQIDRGFPILSLPLGASNDVVVRTIALHSARCIWAPGETWRIPENATASGRHHWIFARGRAVVLVGPADHPMNPIQTVGTGAMAILPEWLCMQYEARAVALTPVEAFRISCMDIQLATLSVRSIPSWFQRFRGLEREAIENFAAKLFRAKAVIDMNRPKVPILKPLKKFRSASKLKTTGPIKMQVEEEPDTPVFSASTKSSPFGPSETSMKRPSSQAGLLSTYPTRDATHNDGRGHLRLRPLSANRRKPSKQC